MGDLIIEFILLLPVYGILIWTYLAPEESYLIGKRWIFKEEPELSDNYIRYIKFASLSGIVVISFVLIIAIISSPLIRLLLVFVLIFYFIIVGHRFLKSLE